MWAVANITVFKNAVIVRSPFLELGMRQSMPLEDFRACVKLLRNS
jgi:hypothetical protein